MFDATSALVRNCLAESPRYDDINERGLTGVRVAGLSKSLENACACEPQLSGEIQYSDAAWVLDQGNPSCQRCCPWRSPSQYR